VYDDRCLAPVVEEVFVKGGASPFRHDVRQQAIVESQYSGVLVLVINRIVQILFEGSRPQVYKEKQNQSQFSEVQKAPNRQRKVIVNLYIRMIGKVYK